MSKLGWFWSAFALFNLQGCQGEYPLPPTLCDDWCHLSESGECGYSSPSSCVRQCEEQGYATRCSAELQTAMQCFEDHPSQESGCGVFSRPNDDPCGSELSKLLDCGFRQLQE